MFPVTSGTVPDVVIRLELPVIYWRPIEEGRSNGESEID
jgi:hypothetical protein